MGIKLQDFLGKRVFMVGIGGCSMSGLAVLLKHRGMQVSGSDRDQSHTTDDLIKRGIDVTIGHVSENVEGSDLLIFTAAVPMDNPERMAARFAGVPELERAELLALLSEEAPRTIAVAGAHGKTSVTAMLAVAFIAAGADPTVHIGGTLPSIGGSVRVGHSDLFITEACEFAGSFLSLKPWLSLVLNIDADHLDYYKTIENIESAFARFMRNTRSNGIVVGCADDARTAALLDAYPGKVIRYGKTGDVTIENLLLDELGHPSFSVRHQGQTLCSLKLQTPGEHNAQNALAVIACALVCGLDIAPVCAALEAFTGASRRFELTGTKDGVKLYHDYGHHPNEFKTVIPLAKRIPHEKLWVVLQPHTYSRTKQLFDQFALSLEGADEVVITDIYAAREVDPGDIHATQLVAAIAATGMKTTYCPTFNDAERYLVSRWMPGDIVLTLGCGNINLLNELLAKEAYRR